MLKIINKKYRFKQAVLNTVLKYKSQRAFNILKKKNLLCIACIFTILLIPIVPVSKAETGEIVPVIIKYKYPPTAEHIDYIESLGQVKYVYDIIPAIGGFIYDYDIDDVESLDDVEEVELGQEVHLMLAQSRTIVNADQVQALGVDGSGVRICIIDTGVDDAHLSLNPLVAERDFVNNDNDATDDHGHGTHVAGIASSTHVTNGGMAPGASLMAAKVLDASGSGSTLDVIAGIEWCVEGPDGLLNTADDADVISMSLGSSALFSNQLSCDSQAITQASNNAVTQGTVVVAAAGNNGLQAMSSPGCGSNVIGVGATADDDSIAVFSNGGSLLDVVAPGVSITSTIPGNAFATLSGTSMATPHVSGEVALLLQTDPTLTPTQVKTAIQDNSVDLGAPGFDFIFGHGRIDVFAAQQSVSQPDTIPPTFTVIANPDPVNAGPISIDVIASESLNGVPTVSVKQAGQLTATSVTMIGTDNAFSGTYTVVTGFDGIADISVSGLDLAGNVGTGLSSFVVDTQIPSVTVTNPTQGSTISDLITITATASDNLSVSKVEFFVDGVLLSSDSLAPYSSNWDTTTVANGAHTISAVAHDTAGNTNSHDTTITVSNGGDVTPPAITLKDPRDGDQVSGDVRIRIKATDNVAIDKVEFQVDGGTPVQIIGGGEKFETIWDSTTVVNGDHTISAVVHDTSGNTNTVQVTVTVQNAGVVPPDTTPPVITSVVASPTSSSVVITWNTDESSDSRVDYGLTAIYNFFASDVGFVTSHSITITDLSPSTTYHYRITSTDDSGNSAFTVDSTFTTLAPATLVSISVSPSNPTIVIGSTQQFTATGTFSDSTTVDITNQVTWASSDSLVATINATGLATADASGGTTTISATSGAVVGSTALTVTAPPTLESISVTPAGASISVGSTQQYTATGTFSDATTADLTNEVVWNSSDTAIASISAGGLASTLSSGSTTISATSGTIVGSTTLTVTEQPSDVVTITRAEFRADKGELRVRTTSTDPNATLTVFDALGNQIGVMENNGLGNFELRLKNVSDPGAKIIVSSSSGGSDTWLF